MTVAIEHETKPIPAKLVIGDKEIDVEIIMIENKGYESSSGYSVYNTTANTYTCVEQKYTEINRLNLPPKFKGRE